MKKVSVYFLFFILISKFLYSQDTITTYYDSEWEKISDSNNAVFYRKAYKNNDKLWVVNDYYISNIIQMTGLYKSKKMKEKLGHFIYYFENGNKSSEGNYKNGKAEGAWTYRYESGQKKSEGKLQNGMNHGEWNYWYENGQKKTNGQYTDDKRVGEWTYWNENGILKDKEFFKNGLLNLAEGYFANGTMSYKGKYFLGSRHGVWTYWNTEGRITFKGNFKYGLKDGEWIRYFKEGKMKLNFSSGILKDKQVGGIVRRE